MNDEMTEDNWYSGQELARYFIVEGRIPGTEKWVRIAGTKIEGYTDHTEAYHAMQENARIASRRIVEIVTTLVEVQWS